MCYSYSNMCTYFVIVKLLTELTYLYLYSWFYRASNINSSFLVPLKLSDLPTEINQFERCSIFCCTIRSTSTDYFFLNFNCLFSTSYQTTYRDQRTHLTYHFFSSLFTIYWFLVINAWRFPHTASAQLVESTHDKDVQPPK